LISAASPPGGYFFGIMLTVRLLRERFWTGDGETVKVELNRREIIAWHKSFRPVQFESQLVASSFVYKSHFTEILQMRAQAKHADIILAWRHITHYDLIVFRIIHLLDNAGAGVVVAVEEDIHRIYRCVFLKAFSQADGHINTVGMLSFLSPCRCTTQKGRG
jgi:hypothetical protein